MFKQLLMLIFLTVMKKIKVNIYVDNITKEFGVLDKFDAQVKEIFEVKLLDKMKEYLGY